MQCNDAVEDGVLLAMISLRRQFQRITETVIDLLIRIELVHRLEQNLHSRGSKTPTSLAVLAACTKSVFSCAPWMKHSMFMVYGTTVKECKHSPTCWRFGPRNTLVPSYDDRGAEFAPRFGGQQQGAQGIPPPSSFSARSLTQGHTYFCEKDAVVGDADSGEAEEPRLGSRSPAEPLEADDRSALSIGETNN